MSSPRFDLVAAISREESPLRFLRQLFVALHTQKLRGADDPRAVEARAQLLRILRELGREFGTVRMERCGPHLMVCRVRIRPAADVRLQVRSVSDDFERAGIGGLEVEPEIEAQALETFLSRYPRIDAILQEAGVREERRNAKGERRRILADSFDFCPGVVLFAPGEGPAELELEEQDRRLQARRTFFKALGAARHIMRQSQTHRIPELRKSRAVVHEMVDTLVEEEFSLLGLAAIQDFDPYTFQHSVHVSVLSMAVGQRLGLPRSDLAQLGVAAMFHDMGKTRVPKKVLWKPGKFDHKEWNIMRRHPLSGARELLRYGGLSDLAIRVMLVSAEHHMRFDGSGYPRFGEESAWQQGLLTRIVTMADCFDAMTASRIYMKRPFTPDAVVRYMIENSGRMFDPDLLRVFVGLVGLYPVGSMVRLESGELALVTEPPAGPAEVEQPRVRILEPDGERLVPGEERALATGGSVDPRYRIRAGCHPDDHGIPVDELLTEFYLEAA